MGYSRSIKSVHKMLPFLDAMLEADDKLEWSTSNAHRVTYAIHQAFHIIEKEVRKGNRELEKYSHLKNKFIIRTRDGRVIAEPKDTPTEVVLIQSLSTQVFSDVVDTMSIIGAALSSKADKMHFPDAVANELVPLYNWCQKHGLHIIISPIAGLTLTKEDPENLGWTPPTVSKQKSM